MLTKAAAGLALILGLIGVGGLDAAASSRAHHRPGCGRFCRQAGGLGGSPGVAPCAILNRQIHEQAGSAAVRVRCHGRGTSRGAVVIWPHDFNHNYVADGVPAGSYDGVDLTVPRGATVTFQIPLSKQALALLRRKHRVAVDVLVELNTKPVVQVIERFKVPLIAS
jgi:hypothetical protein